MSILTRKVDTKKVFSDSTAAVFRKKFYFYKVKGSSNILSGAKHFFSIFIFPKNRLAVHRFCEDKSCLEIETLFIMAQLPDVAKTMDTLKVYSENKRSSSEKNKTR